MKGALVISSLLVSGAVGIQISDHQLRGPPAGYAVPETCGQFDEALKSHDSNYLGSSLKLGLEDAEQKVSWETASKRVISGAYTHKSSDYARDKKEPNVQFGYSYGLEPNGNLVNGFETVEVAGCSVKGAMVSEMATGEVLPGGATIVGGLRPTPGENSHVLLGQRAPRVSFCFPKDTAMDGRLVWGAPEPNDGKKVTLNIAGGMTAHHWAVNVTGMSMRGIDSFGKSWSDTILDSHREKVATDANAYWIAVFSTGENTLVVPKEVLTEMKRHLDVFNLVDCNTSRLPSLIFELDGQPYTVSPKDYLIEMDKVTDKKVLQEMPLHFRPQLSAQEPAVKNKCAMVFAPPTPFEGVYVLGQPFLRLHATTFDFEKRQIVTVPHEGSCWSAATRSQSAFKYVSYVIALAMSFGAMF